MSMPQTLIQAPELAAQLHRAVVFDCSFDLADPTWGRAQFEASHIAGAQYAHLDEDLSAKRADQPRINAGRHPLPTREAFAQWLGAQGVAPHSLVVVYDRNAHTYCGRLWWMCQWAGHRNTVVLDGGLAVWQAAGGELASGPAKPKPTGSDYPLSDASAPWLSTAQVHAALGTAQTVIDARAPVRFRGEQEPLDAVAGHIPGALNRPFALNFAADGRFKPAAELRAEFDSLLAGRNPASVAHHCGSGVTATPNILAMLIAGYPLTALYPGSWSEWSSTPSMPVATGG